MRLGPVLLAAAGVMLLAGAAAAATQAGPAPPAWLGAIAAMLGCPDGWDATLMARDALDEAEFAAALDPSSEAGE
ncbi:hypothetical protein [Paracraurococcus ruber]|uniref:hypothetical protein n=1 Tax=Paracraurococcus ruber TaxID=77675 RepID=UPI00130509EC|nr:hypothetical protein [Paracraurococcus ruber]